MELPDIAICSYLGDSAKLRKMRLDNHLSQRQTLAKLFPNRKILSICSGYTPKEQKVMKGFDCHYLSERTYTWRKRNMLLEKLYEQKELKCILFLDDDTMPREPKPDDMANGYLDTPALVNYWFEQPQNMPGPVTYFAIQGLKYDIYFRSEPMVMGKAPIMISGAAMLIRNDLGIMYSEDLVTCKETGLTEDGLPFRVKCEAEGKFAAKVYRAFFKIFSNSRDNSTWFTNIEERRRVLNIHLLRLRREYPQVFNSKKKTSTSTEQGFLA